MYNNVYCITLKPRVQTLTGFGSLKKPRRGQEKARKRPEEAGKRPEEARKRPEKGQEKARASPATRASRQRGPPDNEGLPATRTSR